MLWLALKTLFHEKGRLFITLMGITFATILVLAQVGMYLGMMGNATAIIRHIDADIWVASRNIQNFDFANPFPEDRINRVRALPEVEWTEKLLLSYGFVKLANGGREQVQIVGYNPDTNIGAPWSMLVGTSQDVKGGKYMIIDTSSEQRLGKLDIGTIWELTLARSRLREVASGSREEEIGRARATYDAAISDMELAKKTLGRYEGLYKEGVIPKALLEEKENAYKVALARVKEAEEEKRLVEKGPKDETIRLLEDTVKRTEATVEYYRSLMEKTVIRAPISGKIIHKYLEEGEIVNTMSEVSPLVDIADVERVRINAEVDETDAGRIEVGDPAEITSDTYPGKLFQGEIEEIAGYVGKREIRPNNPAKNLDMKVIQVKIKLKEKTPLKLGMTVDVRIMPENGEPSRTRVID